MSHHLRSCLQCARHIRISETACPFCGAPVPASRRTPPEKGTPARRLRRAAAVATLAAAGTASPAMALTACGSDNQGTSDAGAVGPDAAYGGPPPVDLGDAQADAPEEATTGLPSYGAPEPPPGELDAESDSPVMNDDAAYDAPSPIEDARTDVLTGVDAYGGAQVPDATVDAAPDASDAAADVVHAIPLYGAAQIRDGN